MILSHYCMTITVHSQRASQGKSEAGRLQVSCMWTHCLKSVSLAMLTPSWTTSWAWCPLYWTTLTLDSLAANWKEKHCIVTVCFGLCVLCLRVYVFLCQHFCVPPILTNYIQTARGESLERHERHGPKPETISLIHTLYFWAFPNSPGNTLCNILVSFWRNNTNHRGQMWVILQSRGWIRTLVYSPSKPRMNWEDITLTFWSLASLSITVMIKSLARAKFVEPILSELSTMNARSTGAHLHSWDTQNTHINPIPKARDSHRTWEYDDNDCVLDLVQTYHNKLQGDQGEMK